MTDYVCNASDEEAIKEGCTFDEEAADRAVKFIETYVSPSTLGTTITLLDWQRDLTRKLFGWQRGDRLRFRRCTISTGKKQGKTLLSSGLLTYALYGGLCPSPFVCSASTSRENASQVYRELSSNVTRNPKLKAVSKCLDSFKEIRVKAKSGRYRAFSADAGSSEGENLSFCLVDEAHAHQSDRLYRALEYSTISRPDSIFANVSTAGVDQSHFWFDVFTYAQKVQAGEIIDTSLLPAIHTTPTEADIEDPATWQLANPSLGTSFSKEDFGRDLARAKAGGTADLLSFRRYRLNQWCVGEESFIDPAKFDQCLSPISEDQLRQCPCFIGCDLSQTTDPCSVTLVWCLGNREYFVRSKAWVCDLGVRKREETNLPKYRTFAADGSMTITPGSVNDYRLIKTFILESSKKYQVREVVFDQYNAIEMCSGLMAEGLTVFRQPQNHKYYTSPMKEFSICVDEKRLKHGGEKLLRWALGNTRIDMDSYGNQKPSRDKSTDKIDPCISTLMGFARAMETQAGSMAPRPSVYESRGLFFV